MRKAFQAAAALAAVALVATGCAKPSSSSTSSTGSGTTAAKFTGCMVTDTGGINDKSFNQASWAGMQAAAATSSNITVKYLPSTTTSDYAKNISTFIGEKCGIIVTVGFLMGPATEAAAKANPKQKFAIVDCSYASACLTGTHESNINQLVFNTVQDAFLGGYLAAGMTKTGKVATYGGEKFGTVTIYMDGFWDGVQYYNKQHHTHVQVLGWSEPSQNGTFAGSFTNITAGQTIANTFITDGADIIFPVAGGVGLGSAKAVQTADSAGKNVSMFWVDTDGCVSAATYCKYFDHQRGEGHQRRGEDRRAPRRPRPRWRQLHRHARQRRGRAGAVPRLGEQGPRVSCRPSSTRSSGDHQPARSFPPPRAPCSQGTRQEVTVKLVSVPGNGRGH